MLVVRAPALAVPLVLLAACQPALPGERVGTYRITMRLTENTCGPEAVYLEDGRSFSAELRADGKKGYWRIPDQPALEGSYDAGKFSFSVTNVAASSTLDAGNACQIIQVATTEGSVSGVETDAGTSPQQADAGTDAGVAVSAASASALTATLTLTLFGADGTDCTEALSPMGPYAALPCTVAYELSGTAREPF